ncbi:hypothetical protein [Ferroplasma sp.]
MSQQKFVNRNDEMEIFEHTLSARGTSLFIIYGRGRWERRGQ